MFDWVAVKKVKSNLSNVHCQLSSDVGFTMVELVVTMGVIAVLVVAAVSIIRPADYIKRSNDTRRMSDLKVLQAAIEQYYGNENGYPATGTIPITTGAAWTFNSITYLTTTPKDPKSPTQDYYYAKDVTCGGTSLIGAYVLCANLEASSGSCTISSPSSYNYCVVNPF